MVLPADTPVDDYPEMPNGGIRNTGCDFASDNHLQRVLLSLNRTPNPREQKRRFVTSEEITTDRIDDKGIISYAINIHPKHSAEPTLTRRRLQAPIRSAD